MYARGAGWEGPALRSPRAPPHWPQNLNPGGFSSPHVAQVVRTRNASPHCPQNFIPSGFAKPHAGHVIQLSLEPGLPEGRVPTRVDLGTRDADTTLEHL